MFHSYWTIDQRGFISKTNRLFGSLMQSKTRDSHQLSFQEDGDGDVVWCSLCCDDLRPSWQE